MVKHTEHKLTILAISKCTFSSIKYTHIVGQTSPPSISGTFLIFPNWNSTYETTTPHSLSSHSLVTSILLSVLVKLTTLGTSYKCNHTVFVLLIVFRHSLHPHLSEYKGLNLAKGHSQSRSHSSKPLSVHSRPGHVKNLDHLYGRKSYQQGFKFQTRTPFSVKYDWILLLRVQSGHIVLNHPNWGWPGVSSLG